MKYKLLISIILIFSFFFSFAQKNPHENGGRFLKRIENNFRNGDQIKMGDLNQYAWNFDSKTKIEILLFGDYNAAVEFFFSPSFEGASGFRIVEDTINSSYSLEIKYICNYEEAIKQSEAKFPSIGIPAKLFSSLPKNIDSLIYEYNLAMRYRREDEMLKLYKVGVATHSVSQKFAKKIYTKMVSVIRDFQVKGKPNKILDGYNVTFRNVVNDELWTLNIHMPQGDIETFSNICRQIIIDVKNGNFDETKFIPLLNK